MASFRTRIKQLSKENGKIILANDYETVSTRIESKTIDNIKKLRNLICGLKLNFHLLLPLGRKEIININKVAHNYDIQTIADIKLNDIGNTNRITTETLWNLGFDAVIVNPIMGFESLKKVISSAHKKSKGVITICHMSAPEAKLSYDMKVSLKNNRVSKLYQLFLNWSSTLKADGIIVGATYPEIIKYCRNKTNKNLDIYSPGIGTQGGNVKKVLSSGSDYLIVGRTILNSKQPFKLAKELSLQTL